jgi:hypothetical protein
MKIGENNMEEFNNFVNSSSNLTDKEEMIDFLFEVEDQVETALESELINLLISLVKMDNVSSDAYESIFDAFDEIIEFETDELGIDYENEEEIDDDFVDEAQRALYKRKGYVRCPNGKIRKRGKCGKPIDIQKSRKMIRARKKFKRSFAKGIRKARKTKRRLGMIR